MKYIIIITAGQLLFLTVCARGEADDTSGQRQKRQATTA